MLVCPSIFETFSIRTPVTGILSHRCGGQREWSRHLVYLADVSSLSGSGSLPDCRGTGEVFLFSRLLVVLIFLSIALGMSSNLGMFWTISVFLTWLAESTCFAVVVLDNVFSLQIGDVDKRQPGESGHYKHISDPSSTPSKCLLYISYGVLSRVRNVGFDTVL